MTKRHSKVSEERYEKRMQSEIPNDLITFTDSAARKVMELIMEEHNPELKLRVYISGGGCSGFQYG